jgi:formate dehydrogenase iron-sulfur subunit
MMHMAEERVVELKARGFAQAGLYDPQGVGGTHVMYVLNHADDPMLYSGLPKEPKVSAFVRLWKGVSKPLAIAAMAGVALLGFVNMVRGGAAETTAADEAAAKRLQEEEEANG